ncbi:MAG TPA: branched-chain amino acid ABC transporter substrate-binding protein, partial [Acidimicrobiia bacterium]|nr:branched-chain amino acid ABC transporter substrate-binding protein [Acidimicrobiia bacterium]
MSRRLSTTLVFILAASILPLTSAAGAGAAGGTPVVKIGVLAPLDAGLTEFGQGIRNSVQVAVDRANKKQTIPGWTIELVAIDDSSDPATGAAGAATLAADPDVIGVVGTYNSGVSVAALPVLAPAGLALVSPSNTLADLTLGPDPANPTRPYDSYFRMVASDALQAPFLAERAYGRGLHNIAVVSETKAVSKGLADAFATAFADAGGTVTIQDVVPDGATDFTDFLDTALADEPDAIFFGGEYPVAAALRDQATAAGFTGPVVGGDGIKDDAYIDEAGAASKGTLASTVGVPLASLATAKKFLAAYEKAKFDTDPTDYGPYAYDAANLIIAAAGDVLDGQTTIPADARAAVVTALQDSSGKGV